jgi:hypothetical protein
VVTFTLAPGDAAGLRSLYDRDLSLGRAFVPGAGDVAELTECELVVEHGESRLRLAAQVVFVKAEEPGRGVGLQLAAWDGERKEALRAFVEGCCGGAGDAPPESERAPDSRSDGDKLAASVQERLRGLSTAEQQRIAAGGTLTERLALERMYGPNVWETLLRNPRLTVPEVARIGRKGTLPRPLVELIAANASWLTAGEVQRALLSNPRSSTTVVEKILRAMSKPDLALVPQQTAYPATVRQAAKRVLGR